MQRKNRQTCENVRSRSYKLICLTNLRTAIQAFFKRFSTAARPRSRGRIVLDSARVGHKYGEIIFMSTRYGRIDAGKKWIRWRIHFGQVDRLCWILVCAISLAGCSERSQELEERVTQLQKELNRTQDELRSTRQSLNATNEELARLKAASASASTSTTTSAVSSAAPVSPPSGTPVSGNQPSPPQQPVARSVGLPADRSVTIQWPDSGRAPASANQSPVANPGSTAAGVSSQQAGKSGSGGASNRTVVIQWPESSGSAPPTIQSGASPGAANAPGRSVQQPASSATGRSDRTVIIQWPDSGQSPPPRN